MRRAWFFQIFIVCVSGLLLTIAIAWAGKPMATEIWAGTAELAGADYSITNDGNPVYPDLRLGGEDLVEIEVEKGMLQEVLCVFGRDYPEPPSDRWVSMGGLLVGYMQLCEPGTNEAAMLDILMQTLEQGSVSEESHPRVWIHVRRLGQDWQIFVGCWIWSINRAILYSDGVLPNPEELWRFRFERGPDCVFGNDDDALFYGLRYEGVGLEPGPESNQWTIVPIGSTRLFVYKEEGGGKKGSGKGSPSVWSPVYLANYAEGLPFQIVVTKEKNVTPQQAPRRYGTFSTFWGEIKVR